MCLFEASLLLTNYFSLLEVHRKLSLFGLQCFLLCLFLTLSLPLTLVFESDHLLVGFLKFEGLACLALLLGAFETLFALLLRDLLLTDSILKITDLVFLYLRKAGGIFTSLLYLFHELHLLFGEVAHTGLDLLFILTGLNQLLFGDARGARRAQHPQFTRERDV